MKVPNIEFHGKPSSWSHADKCGRTERQMDMTKVTGPFRKYVYTIASKINKDFKSVTEHSAMSV
jgi:hypothetical protein